MKRLALGVGAVLCLAGLGLSRLDASVGPIHTSAAPSFLSALSSPPAPFTGRVTRVVQVEGYTYHLVEPLQDAALTEAVWVVSLAREATVHQRVDVQPYGRATNFRSSQTNRTFATLLFSRVTATGTPS